MSLRESRAPVARNPVRRELSKVVDGKTSLRLLNPKYRRHSFSIFSLSLFFFSETELTPDGKNHVSFYPKFVRLYGDRETAKQLSLSLSLPFPSIVEGKLIRSIRDTSRRDWFPSRTRPWSSQGLEKIPLVLFPKR